MKRSLPFLALSITLLATACGGNNSGDGGDGTLAAEDPQSVTGTVTWWDTSNESEGPAYDQLIEEFESQYPDITVERVAVSFDSAERRFKTAAQSGDGAPDVLRSDVGWTAGLASLGYLQPLDGTMLLDEIDAFMEGPVEAASYDGEIFGVPQVTDTLGLIYNRELFDQAGIEEPPETWDEFVEVAQTIEEETGVPGTQLNPEGYFTLPMIYGEEVTSSTPRVKPSPSTLPRPCPGSSARWRWSIPGLPGTGRHRRLRRDADRLQGRPDRHGDQRPLVDR